MEEIEMVSFRDATIREGDEATLERIAKLLEPYGLTFTYHAGQRLYVCLNTAMYKERNNRGAGAPCKPHEVEMPLDELRAEMAATSPGEVAAKYGVSRATLYRRIKEAENTDKIVWL